MVPYVDANRDRFLAELGQLCAQPSIAAQGIGLEETASIVEQRLRTLGAQVQRFVIDGSPPLLYAVLGHAEKTMLVYNHYDVQPPDPLDEWESPPFMPEIRDGRFYARGIADDKGDLVWRLQAREAYQAVGGHEAVKSAMVEDVWLARRVKESRAQMSVPERLMIEIGYLLGAPAAIAGQ